MTGTPEVHRVTANGVDFVYLEAGPPGGPLVLLLHGFPDHAPTWRHLLPALAAAGHHAVAPWSRGYHPTGPAPDGRYQSACLAQDAVALLDALSPDRPAAVVGHDWGAAAAYGAALLAPHRVSRFASLALPHPRALAGRLLGDHDQRKRSWYVWFFQMPGLPEMVLSDPGQRLVERLWRDWSPGLTPDPDDLATLTATLARPEVAEAAVEYYRQTFDVRRQAPELAAEQAEMMGGRVALPALYLMGAEDGCVDPATATESPAWSDAPARAEVLDGCGHFLHLERPAEVNRILLDFLSG
jgi:pimeloyl-ACP methyl ester carboxylesterase